MLRVSVVRELLFEVAGLPGPRGADPEESVEKGPDGEDRLREDAREDVAKAQKRALVVIVLDAIALVVLLVLRDPARGFLVVGRSEEMVFTVGVLLIAAHLGFRLAQFMVLRNLERASDELPE